MGSTKRLLAPVLPTIRSEKLTNVPRLLRMDICINSYQQLVSQTSLLPTEPNAHSICRPIHTVCIGSTKRPLAPVLPVIVREKLNNVPRLLRMDICINSYQQLTPQTSVLRTGPIAHCISGPYCRYVWEARNFLSPLYCQQ